MVQQQVISANDFGNSCLYTTVEPTPRKIKINKTEDYIHKSYEKPFCAEKKWYKIIKNTSQKLQKSLPCKRQNLCFAHALYSKKQALQLVAKEWSDNETFLFRNVLWTWLGGNHFLWAKTFPGNNNCFCHKSNA